MGFAFNGIGSIEKTKKETQRGTTMKRLLLTLLLASCTMFAQTTGTTAGATPPQPTFDEAKAYLGLSDAQVTALQQLRQAEADSQRSTMEQIRQKHQAMQQLVQQGSSDTAAIASLMQEAQALQKQLEAAHTQYLGQAVALLTAEQRTKLAALEAAAKLMGTIGQAAALNLLQAPQGPAGMPGGGRGPGRGPGGPGRGMGPGPMGGGLGPGPMGGGMGLGPMGTRR